MCDSYSCTPYVPNAFLHDEFLGIAEITSVNFAIMPQPKDVGMDTVNEAEMKGLSRAHGFQTLGNAYAREHGQRPATIGLTLSSNPVALLAWYARPILIPHSCCAQSFSYSTICVLVYSLTNRTPPPGSAKNSSSGPTKTRLSTPS